MVVEESVKERDKELTPQEKKLFEKEVTEAKAKELASWVENGAFEVIDMKDAPIKPKTGRWVVTWKLTPEGSWVVKASFVIRRFQDAQGSMVATKSATAEKGSTEVTCINSSYLQMEDHFCGHFYCVPEGY